jgi:hypothetical protein
MRFDRRCHRLVIFGGMAMKDVGIFLCSADRQANKSALFSVKQ